MELFAAARLSLAGAARDSWSAPSSFAFWTKVWCWQACRTVVVSRVLLIDNSRICLANVGVVDVLEPDTRKFAYVAS